MRFPVAVSASLFAITFYFAAFWGFEALRVLMSPALGLDDPWRSQIVYWVGRFFDFGPAALLQLATGFAALKLTVAGICAAHIADRIRCFKGGKTSAEILDYALIGVVAVSILSVTPAVWQYDPGLIRSNTLNLVLASVAAALGIIEREEKPVPVPVQAADETAEPAAQPAPAKVASGGAWYSPWR